VEYLLLKEKVGQGKVQILPVVLISIFAVAFILCTFYPPKIPLFQDPIEKFYGLKI
jgi:hypothetical protein